MNLMPSPLPLIDERPCSELWSPRPCCVCPVRTTDLLRLGLSGSPVGGLCGCAQRRVGPWTSVAVLLSPSSVAMSSGVMVKSMSAFSTMREGVVVLGRGRTPF